MSTLNPTKISVKKMQQAINTLSIDLLLSVIDENKIIPKINPISKKPFLMEMMARHWWEGVYLYLKSMEEEENFLNTLFDENNRSVWHELAKIGDHWASREFLDKYTISLIEDVSGRGPWWEWASVSWAKSWLNKLPPGVWRKVWPNRDKDGIHPIEFWLDNRKWALACWGWSHRPEISEMERLRWNEKIKYAPSNWQSVWVSWGV